MRILFLSHCVPFPPDKGDKVRAFHQIRCLSQRHQIHLLAIAKTQEDLQYESALEEWCSEVELFPLDKTMARLRAGASLLTPTRSFTHAYFWSSDLARRVIEIHQEAPPDVVFAYTAAMGPYAELGDGEPQTCIDLVDIDSAKWDHYAQTRSAPLKWIYGTEAQRLQRYEQSLSESFGAVFVTTDRERKSLQRQSPSSTPIVIRNGVDTEFFFTDRRARHSNPKIVFTGQMDYFPNEDAALYFSKEIFPTLRDRHAELSLDLVGRSPGQPVLELGTEPGVTVTGEVPDIRPYLEAAWVFVAPLRIARGVQNKVLEAAAFELPIVCSAEVFKGLVDGGFRDGEHLLVANNETEFANAISRLLEQPDLRASLGTRARQILSTNYSWDENMRQLELGIESRCNAQPVVATQARG